MEKEDFDHLPVEARLKLEKFNVFPEMSDELFQADTEEIIPFRPDPKADRSMQLLAIFGLLFIVLLGLVWMDEHVMKIFR